MDTAYIQYTRTMIDEWFSAIYNNLVEKKA